MPEPGKIKRKAAEEGVTEHELVRGALEKTVSISVAGAARELELHSDFSLRNWLKNNRLRPVVKIEVSLEEV